MARTSRSTEGETNEEQNTATATPMVDLRTEAERRGGVVAARGVQGPSTGRSATYQGTGQLWEESKSELVGLFSGGGTTVYTQCGGEVLQHSEVAV